MITTKTMFNTKMITTKTMFEYHFKSYLHNTCTVEANEQQGRGKNISSVTEFQLTVTQWYAFSPKLFLIKTDY